MLNLICSILTLITALLLCISCSNSNADAEPETTFTAPTTYHVSAQERVNFEGISFNYDKSVFGNVKSEVLAERPLEKPEHKPDYVAPKCRCFTFELGEENRKAVLEVYPLARFPEVYLKNNESVAWMNKRIAGLRRVIEDKNHRVDREIPHLPFVDSHQDFQSKVQHFPFQNGNGILFLMHWDIELNLISNRNLIYRYEGISKDGNFYVTAEMPIKAPFLPDDPPNEFEGFRVYDDKGYTIDSLDDQKVLSYRKGISQRLETLPSEEFRPKLKHFENLISSLSIANPKH